MDTLYRIEAMIQDHDAGFHASDPARFSGDGCELCEPPLFESTEWETPCTLADLLEANQDGDAGFLDWARSAKPGDEWRDIVTVQCVAAQCLYR